MGRKTRTLSPSEIPFFLKYAAVAFASCASCAYVIERFASTMATLWGYRSAAERKISVMFKASNHIVYKTYTRLRYILLISALRHYP